MNTESPLVLRLPPTGTIRIVVQTEAGNPVDNRADVAIETVDDAEQHGIGPYNMAKTSEGMHVWPHVGLNQNYVIEAAIPSLNWRDSATVSGPKGSGEQVTVRLTLKVRDHFLVGRLLSENGTPAIDVRLFTKMTLKTGSGVQTLSNPSVTDDAGRFRVIVSPMDAPDLGQVLDDPSLSMRLIVIEDVESGHARARYRPRAARFDIHSNLHVGDNYIGDAVFGEPPLIAAGVVVDEAGAPIAGASLTVSVPAPGSMTATRSSFQWWEDTGSIYDSTGLDGAFELRGFLEASTITIEADGEQFARFESRPVQRGATDLRLVVKRN